MPFFDPNKNIYKKYGESAQNNDAQNININDRDENGDSIAQKQKEQEKQENFKKDKNDQIDKEVASKLAFVKVLLQSKAFDNARALLEEVEQAECNRVGSKGYCDNPEVYWCKVLLKYEARSEDDLISKQPDLDNDAVFLLAVNCCKTEEQKQPYLAVLDKINAAKKQQAEAARQAAEQPRVEKSKPAQNSGETDEAVKKKLRRVARLIDAGEFDEARERLDKIEQDEVDRTDDCLIPQVYHYKMLLDYEVYGDDELIAALIEKQDDISKNKNYRLAKSCADDIEDDDEFDALLKIKKKATEGIAKAKAEAEAKLAGVIKQAEEAHKNKQYKNAIDLYNQAVQLGATNLQSKIEQVKKDEEAERKAEAERKRASIIKQAEEAYKNKQYKNAIDLYNQAVQLGATNLQSKIEQVKKDEEAERKAEAERKKKEEARKALNSLWDYKDLGNGYVNFGAYPQSKKAGNVNIGEIYDDGRGYYLGSDNCLYEECNGNYYKVEPIKWKVLSRGSECFIVSDMLLDQHRFDDDSNNYANSEIRSWLNNDFYDKAFKDSQQSKIVATNVDNSVSSTGDSSNQYTCSNTSDKVFLLSHKETQQHFSSNGGRKCVPTEYAVARGAYQYTDNDSSYKLNGKGCGWWWLRSPYYGISSSAQYVNDDGDFDDNYVYYNYGGVRCALKFKP